MEEPDTSMRSGESSALRRKSRASRAGAVVDIAGLPIRLRATGVAHQDVLDSLFGVLAHTAATPAAELVFGRRAIALPRRAPDETHSDIDVWHEGTALYLASERHGIRARVTPERADVSSQKPEDELGLRQLLNQILTHMLADHDRFAVHGAAIRVHNHGVLVLGESGRGKSTLALAALEHGWTVLADDLVSLQRVAGGDIVMRGVPKALALPPDVVATTLHGTETPEWDWRERRHLPPDRLDARPVALSSSVVVDHGSRSDAWIEPLSGDVIASKLMASFMSVGDVPLMRRFFPVAAAAARVPSWSFFHARDRSARLSEAARVLEHVASRADAQ